MKTIRTLLMLITISMTFILGDVMASDKVTSTLAQYAWEKRQLIVFSPSIQHPQYKLYKKLESKFNPELEDRNSIHGL